MNSMRRKIDKESKREIGKFFLVSQKGICLPKPDDGFEKVRKQ